jgi:hypothetical protein
MTAAVGMVEIGQSYTQAPACKHPSQIRDGRLREEEDTDQNKTDGDEEI